MTEDLHRLADDGCPHDDGKHERPLAAVVDTAVKLLNETLQAGNFPQINPRTGRSRPAFHYEGATLCYGQDLTQEQLRRMREEAEVFLLLDLTGQPSSMVLIDNRGILREKEIDLRRYGGVGA